MLTFIVRLSPLDISLISTFCSKAPVLGVEKDFQLPVPLNASKSVPCYVLHTELVRFGAFGPS